jgi:uncharacterized membrane protein
MEEVKWLSVNLSQYKALFIVVTAILALLVASPALQRILVYPQTEFFTELSVLGPAHTAENYPYNITNNENYTIFIDLTNQLGSCAYYQVEIKFRNETQSGPNSFNQTSSSLPSLYNLKAVVANKESLEIPVNFAFDYSIQNVTEIVYTNTTVSQGPGQNATIEQTVSNFTQLQANFNSLTFNGETLNLQGETSNYNSQANQFYGNLVFELWIYNSTISGFQYNNRFVDLKFNMTSPVT